MSTLHLNDRPDDPRLAIRRFTYKDTFSVTFVPDVGGPVKVTFEPATGRVLMGVAE